MDIPQSPLDSNDSIFSEAAAYVIGFREITADMLKTKFSIGYARASRLLDQLEDAGYVGPGEGGKA